MRSILLALLPAVLGCTNPKSNSCASFISANPATASPFCATFTQAAVTATANLPAWATNCQNKPKEISKECSCYYTGGGGSPDPEPTVPPAEPTPTPTDPDTPPVVTGDCASSSHSQLVGYGVGTTGGGSGSGVTVTSCAALEAALLNAGVIKISGMLTDCGVLVVASDTSILGIGADSGLTGGGLRVKKATNVILRNLKLTKAPKGKDLIDVEESTLVWIDHCDLSAAGIVGNKDYYDGLADLKHGSDLITISWTKFSNHWKASLAGHSDSSKVDAGKLRLTYHHNLWQHINSRAPSLRFGTAHIYSSCYEDVPTSGVNSRMGAQVLVEANSFTDVNLAVVTDLDSKEEGFARERDNVFVNSSTRITQQGTYVPPYSYQVDPASCVCSLVKARAGTGIVG